MSSFSDEPGRPEVPDAAHSSAETRAGRRAAREAAENPRWWGPVSQAAVVGALSLLPARRYPGWLKQGMTWGSTGLVAAVALTPGAMSGLLKALGSKCGDTDPEDSASSDSSAEARESEARESGAREEAGRPQVSWVTRSSAALVAGGFTYGTWRFAWWADDAAERALRRMRVPAPRLVMAAGAAALAYREAHRDQQAQGQAAQAEQSQRQTQG